MEERLKRSRVLSQMEHGVKWLNDCVSDFAVGVKFTGRNIINIEQVK